jgi:hypothetical protein
MTNTQTRLIQVTAGSVTVLYEIVQDGGELIMRPVRWQVVRS